MNKKSTTIPGGIPVPEWPVPRSNLPKDLHFTTAKPYDFIQSLLKNAPAGILSSAIGDARDLAAAHLDENWVSTLQIIDQRSKGMAQGRVQHHLGSALAREVATHHAEKYNPRSVTCYFDFQLSETNPNEMILISHAELLDGTNSRTGCWTATWSIIAENKVDVDHAEISGIVNCRSWCYEEGTVHMSATQTFERAPLAGGGAEEMAKVLMAKIKEWEKQVIDALGVVYGDEMDGTLKKIRRTLPITRQRLKWDLIAERSVKTRQKKK